MCFRKEVILWVRFVHLKHIHHQLRIGPDALIRIRFQLLCLAEKFLREAVHFQVVQQDKAGVFFEEFQFLVGGKGCVSQCGQFFT